MEDDAGCGDGDNFFEYAADAESDDRCSFQQRKLGRCHQEGQHTGEEEDADPQENPLLRDEITKALA